MHIKMRQGRFFSAWIALTLQFSSVSVSSRSQPRAAGILPSPMPFGSRDFVEALFYPSQKPIFFAPIVSQHLASAWASPFPETCLHLFCPFQPPTAEFVLPEDRLPQVAVP